MELNKTRYHRQLQLPGFGQDAQRKLQSAKVLVVGAGGLGVPALQYLAGMGVGTLGILDGDHISLSNLHRQVLYSSAEVDQPKAIVAQQKLNALNPDILTEAWTERLTPANALAYISRYDLVVDATDNFAARYLINDACVIAGKPFIYGSAHQYEGHVAVFNFRGGPTYRCLYPVQPSTSEIPDCNGAGVLGVVPGIIGCRQALEAVKVITGIGKNLSGYLQVFDFLEDEQYRIRLKANPQNQLITRLQDNYDAAACHAKSLFITPDELRQWYVAGRLFHVIDVRSAAEYGEAHLPNALHHPLETLRAGKSFWLDEKPVVLYCQKGGRSAQAAAILCKLFPGVQWYELQGGLDNWNSLL